MAFNHSTPKTLLSDAAQGEPALTRAGYLLGAITRRLVQVVSFSATMIIKATRTPARSPIEVRALLPSRRPSGLRDSRHLRTKKPNGAIEPRPTIVADQSELTKLIEHPDPLIRRLALDTIVELAEENAYHYLVALINDPDERVRLAAVIAAARARFFSTMFSLILALDDPAAEVRQEAWTAIRHITGETLAFDLLASREERLPQIEALKQWWKERRLAQLVSQAHIDPVI